MTLNRERWTAGQVASRLPAQGTPGATAYATASVALPDEVLASLDRDDADRLREIASESDTGAVLFVGEAQTLLLVPPFPVAASSTASIIDTAPLTELLQRPRAVAVFLLRLGGFTVGFFRGEALIASKTDRRFVKNRHRAGGQSQRRFDRIREKQVHELFGKACETARETLTPYEPEIERMFLGGDRLTVLAFRKECAYFARYGDRLAAKVLHVPGDPRHDMLAGMPREIWSSDVYIVADA